MAKHLQKELDRLKKKLLTLSSVVESSVFKAVRSVTERDVELAKQVIETDEHVDFSEVEVEEDCLKILALHQPVAIDLRFVVSALKINNDVERIGDLAVNIAERAIYLSRFAPIPTPYDFQTMAEKTRGMLKEALDAMIRMDSYMANSVCICDDEIDRINREVYDKIHEEIRKNPDNVEILINYLSISRHLERIADYATNIAEDVIYMIEGTIVRHKPEIDLESSPPPSQPTAH